MFVEILSVLVLGQGPDAPTIDLHTPLKLQSVYGLITSNSLYLPPPQPTIVNSTVNYNALLWPNFGGVELDVTSNEDFGGTAEFSLQTSYNTNFNQYMNNYCFGEFDITFVSHLNKGVLSFETFNSNPSMGDYVFFVDFEQDGWYDWTSDSQLKPKFEYGYTGTEVSIRIKVQYYGNFNTISQKTDTFVIKNIPGAEPIHPVRVGVEEFLLDWTRNPDSTTTLFVTEPVIPVILAISENYYFPPVPIGPTPNGPNPLNLAHIPADGHLIFNWPEPGFPSGHNSITFDNNFLRELPDLNLQAFVYYPHFFIAGNILELN